MTGGRIKRIQSHIGGETFCLTYGDGVSDVNIRELIEFHRQQKTFATLTAVQSPGRFGVFQLDKEQTTVSSFARSPRGDGAWINGGFFVLEPQIFDYIEGDETVWELKPDGTSRPRRTALCLPSSRVLATHGHPAGQDRAGGDVGTKRSPVEDLGRPE